MWNLPAIFNPSNDMALAAGVREYTPPKRIQQMEDNLRTLAEVWKDGPWGWSMATKHRYEKMGIDHRLLPTDEWLAEVRRLSSRVYQGTAKRIPFGLVAGWRDGVLQHPAPTERRQDIQVAVVIVGQRGVYSRRTESCTPERATQRVDKCSRRVRSGQVL